MTWWAPLGWVLALGLGATAECARVANDALVRETTSTSRGRPGQGALVGGARMPSRGPNFRTYSPWGSLLGRTHVHTRYRAAILEAYQALEGRAPQARFVFGEMGWSDGGAFWPHRTHQNGLSADFMVPLGDGAGRAVEAPCTVWNAYCYSMTCDASGRCEGVGQIDFDALAAHLKALDGEVRARGGRITRVVLWPAYHERVWRAWPGARSLPFLRRPSWVRHDDHYHVDVTWKR